jgi:hypothetical protein
VDREVASGLEAIGSLVTRRLGPAVVRWLSTGEPAHVFGLPLLGLPIGVDPDNCWGATLLLQVLRPDLAKAFLTIRIVEGRALCVQPMGSTSTHTPMIEVDLESDAGIHDLRLTFEEYVAQGSADLRRSTLVLDKVDQILSKQGYVYEHTNNAKLPRAHQTRLVRSCVHDVVVGLAALRQDDQNDDTLIGLFECTDHPLYQPGHGVRSLAALVLADAYKTGVSMALRFDGVDSIRGRTTPQSLITLARELGVGLADIPGGRISHVEGVALFAALSGLSPIALSRIEAAARSERVSVESVSYLVISRCWTAEEAEWVLGAAPRPAAILFGDDGPEDWLRQAESAPYGQAAILGSMFRASLNDDGEEGVETSECTIADGVFHLQLRRNARASWDSDRPLPPGYRVALMPRPRPPLGFETSLILADAARLAESAPAAHERILMHAGEAVDVDLAPIAERLAELGVSVVVSPYRIDDLQQIYETRVSRARRVRR